MIQKALLSFKWTGLTCVGLIVFMSVFMGVLLWVFRKGGSSFYSELESLPFQEMNPIQKRE